MSKTPERFIKAEYGISKNSFIIQKYFYINLPCGMVLQQWKNWSNAEWATGDSLLTNKNHIDL